MTPTYHHGTRTGGSRIALPTLRACCLIGCLGLIVGPLRAQVPTDSTTLDRTSTYRVYRADGTPATLDDLSAAMADVDVVFIGEEHNDPVAHHLQADLLARAYQQSQRGTSAARPVALSLEMFQRDVQFIVDEYLEGLIAEELFQESSRPWKNYETDYKPLVEFAREHKLRVIAANAPRRYVNRVSRLGPELLETLSSWAKSWLPPLPYPGPSPAYTAKWDRLMAEMMAPKGSDHEEEATDSTGTHEAEPPPAHEEEEEDAAPPMHNMGYALNAQALWDATMAYAIHEHLLKVPNALVLHMVGSFHVESGLGTPDQLEGYRPGTRRLVVVIDPVDDITSFDTERFGVLGDFIILTDASVPRSY